MAVRTSNFEIAALDADKPAHDAEENLAEIVLNGKYITLWRRPSTGQFGMLTLRASRSRVADRMQGLDKFFTALVLTPEEIVADERRDQDGRLYSERVEHGEVAVGMEFLWDLYERSILSEEQLFDLMAEAVEQHSGFPTEPSSASSRPRPKSGRPSTASSRRVRSTPSS